LGVAVVAIDRGGVVAPLLREGVAVVAIDARGVVVALVGSSTAVIAVDRRRVAIAIGREGAAAGPVVVAVLPSPPVAPAPLPSPVVVAVLLSPPVAPAPLPSPLVAVAVLSVPLTLDLFLSPPLAVAVLPSPLASTVDPVPSALHVAVPDLCRTSLLVATHLLEGAAEATPVSPIEAKAATRARTAIGSRRLARLRRPLARFLALLSYSVRLR
jgi:hypothetical protein